MRFIAFALLLAGTSAAADVEIHRCLQEDGTLAFQELPCPAPAVTTDDNAEAVDSDSETPDADVEMFDFVNPFDEPADAPSEPALPVSSDRAECEQSTRDAIDAIDRELAVEEERAQERLPELLALTRQLRACKEL